MNAHRHPGEETGDPAAVGSWQCLNVEFEGAATHAALLPTNNVLVFGGSALDPESFEHPPPAEVLDLASMTVRKIDMTGVDVDLFCCGHTFLPDGRLLVAGGTSAYPPPPDPFYGGLRQVFTFDPFTERWTRLPDMQEGRWYPTLIRLTDNRVLALSGLRYRDPRQATRGLFRALLSIVAVKHHVAVRHEIYDSAQNRWETLAEGGAFPLYPRLHLLADGTVFYSGVFNTHYFFPGRYPSARWNPSTHEWVKRGGPHGRKNREEGISLLLPLRPPDYRPRILIAGGGHHNLGRMLQSVLHGLGGHGWAERIASFIRADDSVEIIDPSAPEPRWAQTEKMLHPRIHAVGVLLPDGTVAVVGGMSRHGNVPGTHHPRYPVQEAELYDPESNSWRLLAAQNRPRVYHSSALLLPDGRVISMGGNPHPKVIERSIEIFSPPYLFRGSRPLITDCPPRIGYGHPFPLGVDRAGRISRVVLMRPDVITHITNTDQRLLELRFRATGSESLEVDSPAYPAHMPAGYCLVFVLNDDGVPSVGQFLMVAALD